jgi:hypothetical protein
MTYGENKRALKPHEVGRDKRTGHDSWIWEDELKYLVGEFSGLSLSTGHISTCKAESCIF